MIFDKSIAAFNEAIKHIPGGVNSPVRAFKSVNNSPVFISKAKGSKVYDIDGNEYIDYVGTWGVITSYSIHYTKLYEFTSVDESW